MQNTVTQRTNSFLYQQDAEIRSHQVSNVEYYINLQFDKSDTYQGKVRVIFTVINHSSKQLFIEFAGKVIKSLALDGQIVPDKQINLIWRDHCIWLPTEWSTTKATHRIDITYENQFHNTGCGLFAYRESKETYIYSLFAPNYAHTVFPCFDQPDIKGIYNLQVVCPWGWNVLSNENPENQIEQEDGNMYWVFEPTSLISTYLFCINVGDWQKLEQKVNNNLQTNYYCRKSLYYKLSRNVKDIGPLIEFAIDFYEKNFGIPFPFSKYDTIFCPEFNYSGMEHPGAVSLTETYLFNEDVSISRITQRALTVVHEISHMWFGDLVTMKWWKDIWLNEAFAVLISYVCIDKFQKANNSLFNDIWCKLQSYKEYGYEQDINTYTHSVEVPVAEASESQENFDSITYSKGAAVLHQLVSIIGWEDFFQALHTYFVKFQWRNADINDLIKVIDVQLQESKNNFVHKFSTHRWVNEWIQTPSLNEIMATIEKDFIVRIHQQPHSSEYKTLRQHCFMLTIYVIADDDLHLIKSKVFIDSEITDIDLRKLPNFKELIRTSKKEVSVQAVIMNENDEGYFFNLFDRQSLLFFLKNFHICFQNDLEKKNFIKTIHQSCLKGYSSSQKLFECYLNLIQEEQTMEVMMYILDKLNVMLEYISAEEKNYYSEKIFDILLSAISVREMQPDYSSQELQTRQMMKEYIAGFAATPQQVKIIYTWIKGQNKDIHPLFKSNSNVVSGFLVKYFKLCSCLSEEDIKLYNDYWQLYIKTSKYYVRLFDGAQKNQDGIIQTFDQWVSVDGLNQCSLYELEFVMQGINNEYSQHYNNFQKIYYLYLDRFLLTKNKPFIKKIFKKLQPKFGDVSVQIQKLELLREKYLNSQDVDRMFYVKQIQERIDFFEIKLQIQLSASPVKQVQKKQNGFQIELLC